MLLYMVLHNVYVRAMAYKNEFIYIYIASLS